MSIKISIPAGADLRTSRIKTTVDGMIVRGAKLFINEGSDKTEAVVILAPADDQGRYDLANALRAMADTIERCPDHESAEAKNVGGDEG